MNPSINESLSQDTAAVAESLSAMMHKERAVYQCTDYLHRPMPAHVNVKYNATTMPTVITESDRLKIVDWCYGVIDACKFDRETVAIAMDMVDRFLSRPSSAASVILRDRAQFQLLAVSALYTSIKINEQVAFGSDHFCAMSNGIYSVEEIEDMEMILLNGLEWRICGPTSVQMAHHILSLALPHVNLSESTWGLFLDEVRFQTEHAVRHYHFSLQRPSTVAMAAIINALDEVLDKRDRQALLHALTFVMNDQFDSPQDLFDARERLHILIEGDEASPEDGDDCSVVEDDCSVLSDEETVVPEESSSSSSVSSDNDLDTWFTESQFECTSSSEQPKICTIVRQEISPRTVANYCCRRENVLCGNCIRI